MVFRLLTTAAALIAAHSLAHAEYEHYQTDAHWEIQVDYTEGSCIATQTSKTSGFVGIIGIDHAFTISVVARDLRWINDKQKYNATIVIDNERWTGTVDSNKYEASGALHITDAADAFIEAFMRGSQLRATLNGTEYGPYRLAGSRKVIADMKTCMAAAKLGKPNTEPVASTQQPTRETSAPDRAQSLPQENQARIMYPGIMFDWSQADFSRPMNIDGVQVTMTSFDKPNNTQAVLVEIQKGNSHPVSFEMDGNSTSGTVGLVSLHPYSNQTNHLVFTNFTGGAHCCTEVRVADFSENTASLTELGAYDSGGVAPEDIDGDGYYELAVPDERFRDFDAHAGTFPPYRIYHIVDGEAQDVTREGKFAAYHERIYRMQSEACGGSLNSKPGACAGLLGTAATLGVFPETFEFLDLSAPTEKPLFSPYRVCYDDKCHAKKEHPLLKDAIVDALQAWGYTDKDWSAKPEFLAMMRKLDGRRFGDANSDNEISCNSAPMTFNEKQSRTKSTMFEVNGYESSCYAGSGSVVGTTVITRAVCQGEGLPPWLEKVMYSLDGNKLHYAQYTSPVDLVAQEVKECPKAAN